METGSVSLTQTKGISLTEHHTAKAEQGSMSSHVVVWSWHPGYVTILLEDDIFPGTTF